MSQTQMIADVSALALGPLDILLRLLCAMLVGAVIGTEREYTHRPAGMRTHMLVALGACATMITSQLLFWMYRPYGAVPDPARLSAQVITGVGFLGAGTILREGPTIKGLTTAASIWAVACLGVAAGGGYYAVALIGAACIMVTLVIFEWLQKKLLRGHYEIYMFEVTCGNVASVLELINHLALEADATVTSIQVDEPAEGNFHITFKMDFQGRHSQERMQKFFADLSGDSNTTSIKRERSRV